jgi:hypothetical protein
MPNSERHPDARWDAYVYSPDPDTLSEEFSRNCAIFSAPLQGYARRSAWFRDQRSRRLRPVFRPPEVVLGWRQTGCSQRPVSVILLGRGGGHWRGS